MVDKLRKIREKRKTRVRAKISGTASRPRLSVFRSARHIFAQAIVDDEGRTVAAVSTLTAEIAEKVRDLKKTDAAREVGKLLSRKLKEQGIEAAVFDRGRYLYHGRIKALADAAREAGLKL